MTKEEYLERVIERAHEAWAFKEDGYKVDVTILLGRRELDGLEQEPQVRVHLRSKL